MREIFKFLSFKSSLFILLALFVSCNFKLIIILIFLLGKLVGFFIIFKISTLQAVTKLLVRYFFLTLRYIITYLLKYPKYRLSNSQVLEARIYDFKLIRNLYYLNKKIFLKLEKIMRTIVYPSNLDKQKVESTLYILKNR